MEKFIRNGKGYVGIHFASDTEYGWNMVWIVIVGGYL